ncbi:MAG TPA: hypothetical protein PK002_03305 [Cellvibrio sp.]|jgi:hypothetical protein|nr:hypothetical protein [Cellvibrio sp.]
MNSPQEAVKQVADLLYCKGDACDFGVDESFLPQMIEQARASHPTKGISAVKQWMWWDYDISDEDKNRFVASGFQPAIIFANYLIWDSRDRWPEGWNVKTSALVTFERNCFFITRSTVYILVGNGHRKTVDPQMAASLHF